MRTRIFCALMVCCLAVVSAIAADVGFEGTWVTDGVAVYEAAKAAGKSLNNLPQALTIKFKVDAKKNKISGSVTEMVTGKVYDLKDGKVDDKKAAFQSLESAAAKPVPLSWRAELNDENTVTLTRLNASGQPSGMPFQLHRAPK